MDCCFVLHCRFSRARAHLEKGHPDNIGGILYFWIQKQQRQMVVYEHLSRIMERQQHKTEQLVFSFLQVYTMQKILDKIKRWCTYFGFF
jgi:hypothetical protein